MRSEILSSNQRMVLPPKLKAGDKVRFVSPASTPDKDAVFQRAKVLESWGLKVDFGEHAFKKRAYLAGTDEERLADLNEALRDPEVRAIFATRGGKGSYRIADRMDFEAVRNDPKFLIGFSDLTVLHLILWKQCRLVGIHGALTDVDKIINEDGSAALRSVLMASEDITIHSRPDENTSLLTTEGTAKGRLIGGNLNMIATSAGWALPNMNGAILLIEAVNMYLGQIDRELTMLRKAGYLGGIVGVAVGQFTDVSSSGKFTIIDLLRDHLALLNVPILGGLPLGHGNNPMIATIGTIALLDTASGTLTMQNSSDIGHD